MKSTSTTTIYLVRHGATASNRAVPYKIQGRASDLPLDPLGLEQSERVARALAAVPLTTVYSSPLIRAFETARRIALPHRLTPIAENGIIEADAGRWEGLTWDEAKALDPAHHERFHAHPGTTPYPGGESFLDVQGRVAMILRALADAHPGETIAAVAHNVVNRAYLAGVLGLPIDLARALRQYNGGFNVVKIQYGRPQLLTLNAGLHLTGVETI